MKEKVVLAYSGGLDTSVILKWLINKNYDVICYVANLGQNEDYDQIKEKAIKVGASKVYIEDLREELVKEYVFPAVRANAIYEGRYLMGTSLARPLTAKRQVEIALKENAEYVSHGSTGKGNDQVRFELTYQMIAPSIKIIAPWKDPEFLAEFKGRTDLLNYAAKWGIEVKATTKKTYSEDENIIHISHEAGILEDPEFTTPEEVYSRSRSPKDAPDQDTVLEIDFENGNPIKVVNLTDQVTKTKPIDLLAYLNEIGGVNAIGRVDMVENRFIGLKSRGVYESPGLTILLAAHRDLEGLTMDKEVMHLRDMLIPKYAQLIYNGFWYAPEMAFLQAAFDQSQKNVTGKITLALYKGNIRIISRKTDYSLYNQRLASMDEEGNYNAVDAKGFIKIQAIRLIEYSKRNQKKG